MARDPAFDIAKGLGVILVLLGHLNLPFWLINLIYFFHMPLFVMISGYFHKKRTPRELLNSAVRLYLAYLIYGLVFLFLSWIISGHFEFNSLTILFLAMPVSIWGISYFGIFWFIIALMVIKVISQLAQPNYLTLAISLILFFVTWYIQKNYLAIVDLPFAPAQVIMLYPFYVVGYLIKDYLPSIKKVAWVLYFAFILISIFSIIFANGTEGKIVNYHQIFLFNPLIALVLAILGSVSLILLSGRIVLFQKRIINTIMNVGEYSFLYFAIHLLLFAMISNALNYLNINNATARVIIMLLGTLLISRLIIIIFRKIEKVSPGMIKLFLLK